MSLAIEIPELLASLKPRRHFILKSCFKFKVQSFTL